MASKSRHPLKDREVKELLSRFSARFGVEPNEILGANPRIEVLDLPKVTLFLIDEKPVLFRKDETPLPTLLFDQFLARLPRVVVDMGAVPHVCNGADVMSPGVVRASGNFAEGAIVAIVDERHGRYIALGEALVNSENLQRKDRGKVVRNLHYVGDNVWNEARNIR